MYPKRAFFLYLAIMLICVGCNGATFPGSKTIFLETTPPEAEILIDGRYAGLTPKEIIAPPNSTVTISLADYQTETVKTSEIKGEKSFMRFELKELFPVNLAYQPDGSEVFEEGVLLGKTPFKILRTKGPMILIVRHKYFYDQNDSFYVSGPILRAENLKACVKYFPDTVCIFTSNPEGANVFEVPLVEHKITTGKNFLGSTPFETTNLELAKKGSHHLFIFEKEGFYPVVVEATGSFSAHAELIRSKGESIPELPQEMISQSNFVTSTITNGNVTLKPKAEGEIFKIMRNIDGYEVSIADMETPTTLQSGGCFFLNRFLAVRFSDPLGGAKYIAYDGANKRKVKFDGCGFYHEARVQGDIPYRQRLPIIPSVIEEFRDMAFYAQKDYLLFYVKQYDGLPFYFVIESDLKLDKPIIISTLGPFQ